VEKSFLCSFALSRNAVANKITGEIALSTAVGKSPSRDPLPLELPCLPRFGDELDSLADRQGLRSTKYENNVHLLQYCISLKRFNMK
jgi:hypothetical protein